MTSTEGKCPECGNPASDTRQGTLFYNLPPTRLGVITSGAALMAAMHVVCVVYSIEQSVAYVFPVYWPNALLPVSEIVDGLTHLTFAPWVALFVLAAPLSKQAGWSSPMRIGIIAVTTIWVLFYTGVNHFSRQASMTGPNSTTLQSVTEIAQSFFNVLPFAFASYQLNQIARRLPGSPFSALSAVSFVCIIMMLIRAGLQHSGLMTLQSLPLATIAALGVLLWIPPTVFAICVYRQLRAVSIDINADHNPSRV